ncbi:transporter substrate-binding domain-containing protein [Desulfovibrio inopinatus]|uniref:transporter substrate-binding domain-containing protein n=1 Tax=Desulfovibrio inopinatus TaxID=102109 RepID=UPI001B7FC14D|nr:transporter substrate-binding domain-containing protein [Desulfovibrio inopinatus]
MVVLCVLGGTPTSSAAKDTTEANAPLVIKVGVYDNYPKVFEDASGHYRGIFPDILSAISAKEGWKLQYIPGTWTQCLNRLESGEIDVMVDVAYSQERSKQFTFSDESTFINWGVVYTRSGLNVEELPDLQGLRVAVMKGSIHTSSNQGIKSILGRFNIKPSRYLEVDSYKEVFSLLDTEQADAGVVNRIFGAVFAKDYNVQKTPIIFNPRQLQFAFPPHGPHTPMLKAIIDKDLRALKKDRDSIYYQALDRYLTMGALAFAPEGTEDGETNKVILTDEERDWIRKHSVIRYAVDPEFVPYEFLGPDGSYDGIASDYVKLLSKRLGLNFERVPDLTWTEAMTMIKQGKIDVLPCVGKTEERQSFLHFSRPYSQFHRVIITRIDTPFITGLEDIADLRVAVQGNSSNAGFLESHTDIKPIFFATLKQALLSVSDGNTDAMVGNLAASAYWIRKMNLTNLKIAAPAGQDQRNLYFAVRADWPELVRIINKGLLSITSEEEQRIMQRWVGVEFKTGIERGVVRRYIINASIIALIVLAVILFWNFKLKKDLEKRREAEARLRYSNELKNVLSEVSTKFVNLPSRDINEELHQALQNIACVLHSQEAYLYKEVSENQLSCVYHWKEGAERTDICNFLEPVATHAPWRIREIKDGTVFNVPNVLKMDEALVASRDFLLERGVGSFVEVPLYYAYMVVGLLGVASQEDEREWNSEEISFLKLIGQVFTNALMRKKYEDALQRKTFELQQANDQLKDLDRLKSMFIASMSHELRTPLNSIIGFTGVMLQGMTGELNPTQKDQLSRVHQASRHLHELITDVIDISKIESGRIDVHVQSFPLREVIDEAVTTVKSQIKKKGLDLQLNMPEDLAMHTDRKRVLQCLINFLSNAVKYSEHGEVVIDVTSTQQTVEIAVSDTGIGIDEKDFPRLFEAFERFDSHLKVKAGGTGLGLYLTRKLVTELLCGEVFVKSELNRGSTFGMRIPMDLDNAKERQETRPETEA